MKLIKGGEYLSTHLVEPVKSCDKTEKFLVDVATVDSRSKLYIYKVAYYFSVMRLPFALMYFNLHATLAGCISRDVTSLTANTVSWVIICG